MTHYTLTRTVAAPYAETVTHVRAALADQGFGVLTEIDLAATMKAKLDVDISPEVILGACRPALAHAAMQADPSIAAVLPCNVVVRSLDADHTLVEALDPAAMMALADNPALDDVAAEAGRRISAVLADLDQLAPGHTPAPDPHARRA
jgi:uncharacterized protein (DUF302 family)